MVKNDFVRLEDMCQLRFLEEALNSFHVCSQENHPVIFHNSEEFKAAMNIVAFVAFIFRDVRILTFELMDNHMHFALVGEKKRIEAFIHLLVLKLSTCPVLASSCSDIKCLSFKTIPIENLDNLRNVIAYINRNGSVVSNAYSPFSYPWGANRYYFNPEAVLRFKDCGVSATYSRKRVLFHSNQLAKNDVVLLDDYVSPLSYCHVADGESYFRSCRHYFQSISRNLEASKDIARSIGESIFYNDDELYSLVISLCSKKYGKSSVSLLSSSEKIELAKTLHFDYNAKNKQISRLAKIEIGILNQLFPMF